MAATTGDKSTGTRKSLFHRSASKSGQDQFSLENDQNAETLPDERLIELQTKLDTMRGQVNAILTSINQPIRPDSP